MATLKVDVTQDDIDQGMPGDAMDCAVALALQRATGRANFGVRVEEDQIVVLGESAPLPMKIQEWMNRFDAGHEPAPVSFTVELPDEVIAAEQVHHG